MAARGPARTGDVATELREGGRRQETPGNVLPHGGDSAGGEIAVPPGGSLELRLEPSSIFCANSKPFDG